MQYTLIKNQNQYKKYMQELESLIIHPCPEGNDKERLGLLSVLIADYEDKHFKIGSSDPIDIIKYFMEEQMLTVADLKKYIGNQSKVSEVLNKKRSLSLNMIRRLSKGLNIPADLLITEYELKKAM